MTSADNPKTFVNHIKAKGQTIVGTILTIPSDTIAQVAGQSDGDFVLIDMEHVPLTIDIVTRMVHAYVASSRGTKFPIIRIPSHGVEWVKWALDSGASGVIIPSTHEPYTPNDAKSNFDHL